MNKTIVVLTLPSTPRLGGTVLLIDILRKAWQADGLTVRHVNDLSQEVPGDILLMHVDQTVTPQAYLDYARNYPVVLNQRVTDISKRFFSRHIVDEKDGWTGPVIVKTDANYGGIPERELALANGEAEARIPLDERPWRKRRYILPKQYPVFDSIDQVPRGVWRNPYLVVEKLLCERDDENRYVLRNWFFLGDREFNTWHTGPAPVVKAPPPLAELEPPLYPRVPRTPVPQALRDLRKAMGFDYGRFDYAIVDGEAVIYDVNRTTAILDAFLHVFHRQVYEEFPQGIYSYF